MKKLCCFVACCCALWSRAQVTTFPLQEVRLLPGIFKEAEMADVHYLLAMEPDRLLAPYCREAGLTPKAPSYTNWENTGLDGHIGGHYVSALAMMYASTGDQRLLDRLHYMIARLKECQEAYGDGYLGGVPGSKALWEKVMQGEVDVIRQKWVPLYNIHKIFAGLRDAWWYTGDTTARDMWIRFADWFVKLDQALTPQQMQRMLQVEHGGVNEVLADVYALTGDKKYLTAAYHFSHQAILQPLEAHRDALNNLHANTQIPKVIGFERIAELAGDTTYGSAARFFWNTVVHNRTIAIGGNSVREHFNPANDFSTMITSVEGPETCNTYNMLKLTRLLFQTTPQAAYMDFYERALYNHILSSEHPGDGGFVYFTPMRPGHYRVYSQPATSMWCCVGSGMENHAKYGTMIYAHAGDDLYVNLFIASRLDWKENGLVLEQDTRFPEEETTRLLIKEVKQKSFALHLRYPSWVTAGTLRIQVNGKPVSVTAQPGEYIVLKRRWKKGDRVALTLPMHTTTERLPDGSDYVAVLHGPVVLAAKTDTSDMEGLWADDSRMGHVAHGTQYPLQDMPMFITEKDSVGSMIQPVPGKPLTFTATALIHPARYEQLQLIPFYKVHDSRYVLYWEKETPEAWQQLQKELAAKEAAAARLAAMTLDVVQAGEQQPESDHFMKTEQSESGVFENRHWRHAHGWFSYRLTDPQQLATRLRITYYGKDGGRYFKIYINDQELATVSLDGNRGDQFFDVDYAIPAGWVQAANGVYTVRFEAAKGSIAGGVYEVRLLKGE